LDVCNLTKNIAAACVLSLSKPESPRCSNCLQFRLSDNRVLRKFYTEFKSYWLVSLRFFCYPNGQ